MQNSKTDMYAANLGIHESGVSVDELETTINNDFEKLVVGSYKSINLISIPVNVNS